MGGGALKFHTRYPKSRGTQVTQAPMASRFFTVLPFYYSENVGGDPAFGLTEFRPTAIFNVDLLGSDAGFASSMLTFYNDWVVLGYSYDFQVISLETGTAMIMSVVNWPNNTLPTSQSTMEYLPGCQSKQLTNFNGGAGAQQRIKGYVNVSSLMSVKVAQEAIFWGTGTGNPTTQPSLFLSMANVIGSAGNNYQIRLALKLYVKFWNRNEGGIPTLLSPFGGKAIPATRKEHLKKLKAQCEVLEKEEERVFPPRRGLASPCDSLEEKMEVVGFN